MKLLLPIAAALTLASLNGCMTAKDRLVYQEFMVDQKQRAQLDAKKPYKMAEKKSSNKDSGESKKKEL